MHLTGRKHIDFVDFVAALSSLAPPSSSSSAAHAPGQAVVEGSTSLPSSRSSSARSQRGSEREQERSSRRNPRPPPQGRGGRDALSQSYVEAPTRGEVFDREELLNQSAPVIPGSHGFDENMQTSLDPRGRGVITLGVPRSQRGTASWRARESARVSPDEVGVKAGERAWATRLRR